MPNFLNPGSDFRIMQSDDDSLDMEDHYRRVYQENMEILKQINVVSIHYFFCGCKHDDFQMRIVILF